MTTIKNAGIAIMLTIRNVGFGLIVSLIIFSAAVLTFGDHPQPPLSFDSQVWKQQEYSNQRLRMVDDLKPKLMGLSKRDVEQLLGTPRDDLPRLEAEEYNYLLGTERPLLIGMDGVWLRIKFESDHVNHVGVWRD